MNQSAFTRYRKALSALLKTQAKRRPKRIPACWEQEFVPVPAGSPTDARPGTLEKLQVMRARWSLGQQLYHPDDA